MFPGIEELTKTLQATDQLWLRIVVVFGALAFALYLVSYGVVLGVASVRGGFGQGASTKVDAGASAPETTPPSARQALKNQGFSETITGERFDRLEKTLSDAASGIEETDVRVFSDDVQVAAVRVINIHSKCSWKWGSSTEFLYYPNSRCPLEKLLKEDLYRQRFSRARDLVFVGLASYPGQPADFPGRLVENGPELTTQRAVELGRITNKLYPELLRVDRRFWVLPLGRANEPSARGSIQEAAQRSVIVLGIDERDSSVPLRDVLRLIVTTTKVGEVKLKEYVGSATAEPGEITSFTGDVTHINWVPASHQ